MLPRVLEADIYAIPSNFISSLKAFIEGRVAGWVVVLCAFIPLALQSSTNALCII